MNAHDATLQIIADSGIGVPQVTRTAGDVRRIIYRNGTPRADTLARIADACGYDLLLRRRIDDYEIIIDDLDN